MDPQPLDAAVGLDAMGHGVLGFDAWVTAIVLVVTIVLFVTERLRVDMVALLALTTLLLTGVLDPADALSGFANPAVVTVAAMFVLSAGLLRSGAGDQAGVVLGRLIRKHPRRGLLLLMVTVGTVSAFINNTAAVAILLPIMLGVSRRSGIAASKLLMPLSFSSMFGGVCTLIGTSTNLLASQIVAESGAEPFGMFEMAPLGLLFFAVGVAYMMTIGARLVPDHGVPDDLTESFGLGEYLTDFEVVGDLGDEGVALVDHGAIRELDLDVVAIRHADDVESLPQADSRIRRGDRLRVRASLDAIRAVDQHPDFRFEHVARFGDDGLEPDQIQLLEVVVPPGSGLEGTTLERAQFRNRYGATVLAIRHRGRLLRERLKSARLIAGDTLLLEAKAERLPQLRSTTDLIVVSQVERKGLRRRRMVVAAAILAAVVTSATTGLLPIVSAAIAGCVAMVLARCLDLDEVYQAIDWKIVFLLAGVIGLGRALESSGLAAALAGALVRHGAVLGPVLVLSAFYLLTSLLTEAMSNNATVVLLAPIAISTATALGVDPRPFVMAVTFAASASFMTPVGYQTNTLIYGPGRYQFSDFLKVGLPLNVLFWLMATLFLPVFWPL